MATLSEDPTSFSSVEEEIEYWKSETIRYREITNEVQQELKEFRECSEEIERELETQLEQNEKQMKQLKQQNTSLTFECETLKERYEKQQAEKFKQVSDLQTEIAKITVANAELTKDIRALEQKNDDLERTNRVFMVSLEDFELRLNHALERNAFLESELDEKDSLSITVQRLRDEARDLHHELSVRQQHQPHDHVTPDTEEKTASKIPPKKEEEPKTPKSPTTPVSKKPSFSNGVYPPTTPLKTQIPETPKVGQKSAHNGIDRTPLTPSARISALNIVGDLLRKVGALETKLASCRNFVHEQPTWHGKRTTSLSRSSESSNPPKREQANGHVQGLKLRV